MKNGDAPFCALFGLARVTGVDEQHAVDGLVESPVCVSEHDDVRRCVFDCRVQLRRQRVWRDDVMDEEFV